MKGVMVRKFDHGKRGAVWMRGRRVVVALRLHASGQGYMATWKDRAPYISESPISKGRQVNCRLFARKRDAVRDITTMLQTEEWS